MTSSDLPRVARGTPFDDALLERILLSVKVGGANTLSNGHVDRIMAIDHDGILVSTQRSEKLGTGPQKVPAWMVTRAWDRLRRHGYLTQEGLPPGLEVKRSAFVCALLAHFPDVEVGSVRPTLLRYAPIHSSGSTS
jgi:hypothetical protein